MATKVQRSTRYDEARAALAAVPEQAGREPGRRWGIYTRISQDVSGEGLGVARQEADCREKAAEKGGVVVRVFSDNDISAWSGKRRPGYQAMLQAIKAGQIDGVVVYNLDRLTRRPIELEEFMELAERHRLELANVAGDIDLSNHYGQMMARVRGAVARAASDDASMRIKRKMDELREKGKTTGGGRFYGWDGRDCGGTDKACDGGLCTTFHTPMTINEFEAGVVRECCDRVLAGESLNSIHRDLIRRGIETRNGKDFDRKTLRSMLVRARNAGIVERKDKVKGHMVEVGVAKDWEAIVDEDTWRSVRTILEDKNRKKHYHTNKVRHLLSNIATCGVCGSVMIVGTAVNNYTLADGTKRRTRSPIYKCRESQGQHLARRKDPIDEYVVGAVLARIEKSAPDDLLRVHLDDEQVQIESEIRRIDAKLEQCAVMLAEDQMTVEQFKVTNERLREQRNALLNVQEPVRREQVLRDFLGDRPVRALWEDDEVFGIERRRAVIATLTKSIVVHKSGRGSKFDEATVQITWA